MLHIPRANHKSLESENGGGNEEVAYNANVGVIPWDAACYGVSFTGTV